METVNSRTSDALTFVLFLTTLKRRLTGDVRVYKRTGNVSGVRSSVRQDFSEKRYEVCRVWSGAPKERADEGEGKTGEDKE